MRLPFQSPPLRDKIATLVKLVKVWHLLLTHSHMRACSLAPSDSFSFTLAAEFGLPVFMLKRTPTPCSWDGMLREPITLGSPQLEKGCWASPCQLQPRAGVGELYLKHRLMSDIGAAGTLSVTVPGSMLASDWHTLTKCLLKD